MDSRISNARAPLGNINDSPGLEERPDFIKAVETEGFWVVPSLLSDSRVEEVIAAIVVFLDASEGEIRKYGVRNIASTVPAVRGFAETREVSNLVRAILGPHFQLVRSILFDKIPEANWKVAWHQDLTIAVEEKRDVTGYGPWSVKDGVVSVQPPREVLEGMLSVRIHLDPCGPNNGPLRVVSGSHRLGRLTGGQIDRITTEGKIVSCEVDMGGVVIMRPFLLHSSSPSRDPSHRRVVHLDFATGELHGGLRWSKRA